MRTTLLSIGVAVLVSASAAVAEDAAPAADHALAKAGKAEKAEKGKAGASDEQVAAQLKVFCVKWMGFLETRERDNRKGIKWEKQSAGVSGHYVGYSKDYDCILKERSSNGTPVATIVYKELIYEQLGASPLEAEQTAPNVVDATEVTEIFRYSKGDWVY